MWLRYLIGYSAQASSKAHSCITALSEVAGADLRAKASRTPVLSERYATGVCAEIRWAHNRKLMNAARPSHHVL